MVFHCDHQEYPKPQEVLRDGGSSLHDHELFFGVLFEVIKLYAVLVYFFHHTFGNSLYHT